MTQTLIEAIAAALADAAKGAVIYDNAVPQRLHTPCFFITCLRHTVSVRGPGRRRWENAFCIQYLPAKGSAERTECEAVGERLTQCLAMIGTAEERWPGTDMHYEIEDGALHFFVSYNCFTQRHLKTDRMERLEHTFSGKG